jgi:hypothetical protein
LVASRPPLSDQAEPPWLSKGRRPEVPVAPKVGTCQFTPPASRFSMNTMRPFKGMSSTTSRSITWPRPPLEVSSREASPRTSIVSLTLPSLSWMFTVAFWPRARVIPERTNRLNPAISASTR